MNEHLPIETWREILQLVAAIESDVPLSDDEERQLLGTKKAMTLVCRNWRAIATEYLYTRVVIYSYRSLQSLLDVLEQSNRDSVRLVHSGNASSAPGGEDATRGYAWWTTEIIRYNIIFSAAAVTSLGRAIKLCVNLQRYNVRGKHYEHPPLTFTLLGNTNSSLTSIEWGAEITMTTESIGSVFEACPDLTHLGLGGLLQPMDEAVDDWEIRLPKLRTLNVAVTSRWPVLLFLSHWRLPSLKEVRFTGLVGLWADQPALSNFARAHTPSITSLSFSSPSAMRQSLVIPLILVLFPHLQHLTIQLGRFMHFDTPSPPTFTTLIQSVDIFGLPNGGGKLMPIWWDAELMNLFFDAFLGPMFPALKEVRLKDVNVTKVKASQVEEDDSGAWWRTSLPDRRVRWWNEEVVGRFRSAGVRLVDIGGRLLPEVRTRDRVWGSSTDLSPI